MMTDDEQGEGNVDSIAVMARVKGSYQAVDAAVDQWLRDLLREYTLQFAYDSRSAGSSTRQVFSPEENQVIFVVVVHTHSPDISLISVVTKDPRADEAALRGLLGQFGDWYARFTEQIPDLPFVDELIAEKRIPAFTTPPKRGGRPPSSNLEWARRRIAAGAKREDVFNEYLRREKVDKRRKEDVLKARDRFDRGIKRRGIYDDLPM